MVIGLRHRRAAPRGRSLCERTCRHPFPADGHSAPALSLGLPLLRPRGREKPSGWAHLPALLLGITPSFRRHLGLVTGCRGGGAWNARPRWSDSGVHAQLPVHNAPWDDFTAEKRC